MPLRGRSEAEVLRDEGRRLLAAWPQAPVVVALAIEGRALDTRGVRRLAAAWLRARRSHVRHRRLARPVAGGRGRVPTSGSRSRRSRCRTSSPASCSLEQLFRPLKIRAASPTITDGAPGAGSPRYARTRAAPSRRIAPPHAPARMALAPAGAATKRRRTMSDDLHDFDGLAASLAAHARRAAREAGATPPAAAGRAGAAARAPEHGDVTTNAALVTRKRAGQAAARAGRRAGRALAGRPGRRALRALRGRRPRLPQPLPQRRLVPRRPAAHARRRRRLRPRRRCRPAQRGQGQHRVRQRQPDRARCTSATRATPPTATRSAASSPSPATT